MATDRTRSVIIIAIAELLNDALLVGQFDANRIRKHILQEVLNLALQLDRSHLGLLHPLFGAPGEELQELRIGQPRVGLPLSRVLLIQHRLLAQRERVLDLVA